jgi:hypothetical protein
VVSFLQVLIPKLCLRFSFLPCVLHVSPSHPPSFYNPNLTWTAHIMKLKTSRRGGRKRGCHMNFWKKIKVEQDVLGGTNRLLSWYDTDRIENEASNNSSIIARVFVAAGTGLPSRCLATIGKRVHRHGAQAALNSMEQISWESDSRSASHVPNHLWNWKVHYCITRARSFAARAGVIQPL